MFSGFIFFLFSLRTHMSKTPTPLMLVLTSDVKLRLSRVLLCRQSCCCCCCCCWGVGSGVAEGARVHTDTAIHRYILGSIYYLCSLANTQSFTGSPCMSYYVHMCSVFMILLSYSPIYASPVLLILVNYVCKLVNDIVLKLAEYWNPDNTYAYWQSRPWWGPPMLGYSESGYLSAEHTCKS